MNRDAIKQKVYGCLLGGLIGDAMGAPVEGWRYERIVEEIGYIDNFEGGGTDDSIIKHILCEALIENGGHATADDFAESFLRHQDDYKWFFVPVRNMFHKIQDEHTLPIEAGRDNMASSSSAMSISPIGIVNACDPRTAAAEAYEAAGLIHSGCCSYCRDAASAIAAAVAAAFIPGASVESVLDASTAYLHKKSAGVMRARIADTLALAREANGYTAFRRRYYGTARLYNTIADSRETVPVALACFFLANGEVRRSVAFGANFGRDADTIATMAGAIAGAFAGIGGIEREWIEKATAAGDRQDNLADEMTGLIIARHDERAGISANIDAI
jgi:ADP-ribosylglycohydrolase